MSSPKNEIIASLKGWDVCSAYPPADWQEAVDEEKTKLGYREWVIQELLNDEDVTENATELDRYWDVCSKHPPEDWRCEVTDNNTQLGYREWVEHRLEADADDAENELTPPKWAESIQERQFARLIYMIIVPLRNQFNTYNSVRADSAGRGILTRSDVEQNMIEFAIFHNNLLDYLGDTANARLEIDPNEIEVPCPGPADCDGTCDDLSCDADK